MADADLTLDDVTGLAAYPGGGSSIGTPFAGPPLADVYDALGLRLDYLMGNYEGPAQRGPVLNASLAISGGLARHVVVYRTVTEGSARQTARAAGRQPPAGPSPWITAFGDGPGPIGYALLARRHFRQFGTTREQLAQIPLNARKHARLNPAAVMRGPLSLADYLSARMISDPLSLYDCDVHCDGATAGSVFGALHGTKAIPAHWTEPLHNTIHSALLGFDGAAITSLAQRTVALAAAGADARQSSASDR